MSLKKAWFQRPHRLLLQIVCVGAIGIELWEIFKFKPDLKESAPLVILGLLSLYVLAYLEEQGPRRDRLAELGIENIFRVRADLGQDISYRSLLESAKRNLFIVGVTLNDVSRLYGGELRRRASDGCTIDLLLLHPKFRENKDPILDPVAHAERRALRDAFAQAIATIRSIAADVSLTPGTLSVRFYETSPSVGLTIADGHNAHGRMHMEIVPHQIPGDSFRPILVLTKDGREEMFSEIHRRYRELWKVSKEYLCVGPSGEKINENLDQQISEWLGIELIKRAA